MEVELKDFTNEYGKLRTINLGCAIREKNELIIKIER